VVGGRSGLRSNYGPGRDSGAIAIAIARLFPINI